MGAVALSYLFGRQAFVPIEPIPVCFIEAFAKRLARRSKVERRRQGLFLAGWVVLALSLVSPLHGGGERSFTLHMIEHEMIMLFATALLAASHVGGTLAWGLPTPLRQSLGGSWKTPLARLWRALTAPVTATVVQAVVMWAWHAPALLDRTLQSQPWHIGQHLSFVTSSLLFWVAMLDPRRGGYLLSAACLIVTSLIEGALGALMALSGSPWYGSYAAMRMSGIGLDPTTDQQLAGLIMWIPGGWSTAARPSCCSTPPSSRVTDMRRLRTKDAGLSVAAIATVALVVLGITDAVDGRRDLRTHAAAVTGGDPARGEAMFIQYGCGSCHGLKHVRKASGAVGPPLDGIAVRAMLAGRFNNTPSNLESWIREPQKVSPGTAMPDLNVGQQNARDISAFLYTRAE